MPVERRKIFISWSKRPTDVIASELARFLRHMFDNVDPFVSKDNVAFGSLSIGEIHRELAGTTYGIVIVTRANQSEPWLNFEAGSLAKTIPDDNESRVVPLLIDHESMAQLTGPIANLQAVMADHTGLKRLFSELADSLDVDAAVFGSRWESGWTTFDHALAAAKRELAEGPEIPDRSAEDMLEEVVTLLRSRSSTATVEDEWRPAAKDLLSRAKLLRLIARDAGINPDKVGWSTTGGRPRITFTWDNPLRIPPTEELGVLRDAVMMRYPNAELYMGPHIDD